MNRTQQAVMDLTRGLIKHHFNVFYNDSEVVVYRYRTTGALILVKKIEHLRREKEKILAAAQLIKIQNEG